ncbi:hypothetical protein AMS68_007020 [Peltaster fructicola]|uniref:K Homology domain-containing protein n=1 Tax=Peltaster fructicola TaxID=286661 RepID=A0A6H0Y3C0_9PEZI|nr:hypothetical protein AMS68_007020 [Peltaster fructicola]
MASEGSNVNGTNGNALTAAERLMQQHDAHETHNPTIEDVPDEDIIAHPPPSGIPNSGQDGTAAQNGLSAKAAGKQPAKDTPAKSSNKLDTASEELFPALGAPKAPAANAAASMWSKKPTSTTTNGAPNGTAYGHSASTTTSRASTPASGILTPASTAPSARRQTPQMSLPGRYTESINLHQSVLKKRDELKRPVGEILRDINKKSKATVEMRQGPNGVQIFEGTGPVDAVRTALKEVAGQLCTTQNLKVPVPVSVRGKIVGKQGTTIQAISKASGARIQISKQDAAEILEDDDLSATVDVVIEGDPFAVQIAKQDILKIAPQSSADRSPATFTPQSNLPIQLSGDRQAIANARAEIDSLVAQLQRELTIDQTQIERGRHQFIVGNMGISQDEFMAETGCSIVLPPDGDESEDIYVVGPPERIEAGINKVMDLAHAAAAKDAQAHARAITRYLQQRQAIQQLERQHNARIVPDSAGQWQIYARDGKDALKARSDIMNLVSGHPPSRFAPLDVDPFYHNHLRQAAAQHIREQHGVRMVVPGESEDGPILLVFEDRVPSPDYELPRRAPAAQDVKTYQQALEQAQQHILDLISGQQQIVSQELEAPIKFHDKIKRHIARHQESQAEDHIPVQVLYGAEQPGAPAARRTPAPSMNLRGPQDSVDALFESLLAFIEQEKQDETERGFTLDFLSQKKHLQDLVKRLEDESTHRLIIAPAYHRDLIGQGGSQVNRLQERYGVRVQFPRTNKVTDDATSEAGDAPAAKRNNQPPNEVVIKGPSRGADACRDEILSLLQYLKDNSHTATVSVAPNQLPSLIGSGGREMDALRLESGAQIDVPSAKDIADGQRAEIKLKGSKQAVETAKKLIEEKAKVFDNSVTRSIDVDRRHHRVIIGPQGSTLIGLLEKAGGPTDTRGRSRAVRFPKTAEEGNSIRIEGQTAMVDKLCASILSMVAEQESQTTDVVEVKPDKHRLLIGRGGEAKRQLEQQFSVNISIPRETETGPQRSQVRVTGQPDNVGKCKAHITEITKEQEGETVQIPRKFHHAIADNGQFFRRLRNDHKVTVDHSGQRPPPRNAAPAPSRSKGGAVPLITDEPGANSNSHSWESHNLHTSEEAGDIPWVLLGPSPEAVAAARAKLDKALDEVSSRDTVGYLILPDPRLYRHVIGPGGSEINRIRTQTGTKIQVPRDQKSGEAIEISGNKSGVEEARDIILEIVQNNA